MVFEQESEFEKSLISLLTTQYAWDPEILESPDEERLIQNWAQILFENNNTRDLLNDCPLTRTEMEQILEQIRLARTPLKLNSFINGGHVGIKRDNPDDKEHLGKEVYLKIYDRHEIAAGQSRYQIARQPRFKTRSKLAPDRRGDLMLLINGMPVIHIELKRSGVDVSQAAFQIEKYAHEGVFTGLFALVQVFVAMNPEETLYFANPGSDGMFNRDFYFHWADINNEPINVWKRIAQTFLSIPMAHQLIGFYTVADDTDGVLKVMRSYQYYAANAISDKVAKHDWTQRDQLGGYVWHTTGSGKTMTSFKAAHLIATSDDADKVVFLMDRIELGTQSLFEYRNFAGAGLTAQQKANTVQETEDTQVLIKKLKSDAPADTLIVTSIQKMSNISEDNAAMKAADLAVINAKRIVFIVDEAHRSTFGEMLQTIKRSFPYAVFFGFTGTPIQDENQKKDNTTATIFGDELHRYSIADGIRDKNVLGFDPYKVLTFKDVDVRKAVALKMTHSKSVAEATASESKAKTYQYYIYDAPMGGYYDGFGNYVRGVEDEIPTEQYREPQNQRVVVQDIIDNWEVLSRAGKFHAIFATSSIPEALEYYRLFKEMAPELKVAAMFDESIDNVEGAYDKEKGLEEIIDDYNTRYDQNYSIPTFPRMKKDIAARLAHKQPYGKIDQAPEQALDLLIVVDQMLTGFDSKWVNTLYLDKELRYENIIQAFSRTNRLFGPEKPFGTIKYYRRPHTMQRRIEAAVKLYSGDKPLALFVDRLPKNLRELNRLFGEIKDLFDQAGIPDFATLPENPAEIKKFAQLFQLFAKRLEAAKVQGFTWKQSEYTFNQGTDQEETILLALDESTYAAILMRYSELMSGAGKRPENVPFALDSYVTTIETPKIDHDYINTRFEKFIKFLNSDSEELQRVENELHRSFASLPQEEQKFANLFLHDIHNGDVEVVPDKSFREYIVEYMSQSQSDLIHRFALCLGLDEALLRQVMEEYVPEALFFNRSKSYNNLKKSVNYDHTKTYFESVEKKPLKKFEVNRKLDKLLREFIEQGGVEFAQP